MKTLFFTIYLVLTISILSAQNYFRSGIFLHHSTGNYIWGPNPDGTSTTTIPEQMNIYNSIHSFNGSDSIKMSEEWWTPGDNEWSTQHEFFEGNTSFTDINDYLENNKIIVIKSCFPSSSVVEIGESSDTLNPTYKSVYNYKWHWRHIVNVMENHPENFFVIWTNAPLEIASTTTSDAGFSKSFCIWAKDTLANGLDAEFGPFPANVYVFDFFNKLTGANGIMLNQYRTSEGDSHPNGAATDLVAPQFVNEIFDAAIAYETYTHIENNTPDLSNIKLYPNPATEILTIEFSHPEKSIKLNMLSASGQLVYFKTLKNSYTENIDLSGFSKGIYFLQIQNGNLVEIKKIVIQ